MPSKGTVFQKGGGGTNFEQYVQAAFLTTLAVGGNAPCIPQNEIEEIILQSSNRGWETDDLLVITKSTFGSHNLLIQAKHTIVFSEDNEVFKKVILAFWKDFNNTAFNKTNDRLIIVKDRLNNLEKNHIKGILNYAKSHSSENDFLNEVNIVDAKKDRLDIFRKVLKVANDDNVVDNKSLWEFLKCLDILGYDFLHEGSVDETYLINLIKLSRSINSKIGEKDIWNSIITLITKYNPAGGSFTKENIRQKEFYKHFEISRLDSTYKSVEKLLKDSEAILKPIKNKIGNSTNEFHIHRSILLQDTIKAVNESNFVIVTGKPGVGKSATVKDLLTVGFPDVNVIVFRADQFNKPHLANVLSDVGVHQTIPEIFSCFSLIPEKIIFIDSLEKLLEDADPDNAFKQLLSLIKGHDIKIIGTSRKYAVELLIQKYGIEPSDLKTIETLPLSEEELTDVSSHFPILCGALKNKNIKALLQSPKYLDFSIRSLTLSEDDFATLSSTQFKDKLWNSLVCNSSYRANGLPAKREKAFLGIAVNRAKEMKLFIKPLDVDEEATDLLENDDIIFQDGNKRKYAPSHDILEDWALVKYVAAKYEDHSDVKIFFSEMGNEPAIRRAFRLWVEDYMVDEIDKITMLVKSSLSDTSIERYWADEILIAIFKSDNSKVFFTSFEKELLENNAVFLNRCLHLIKTACKENDFSISDTPILLPNGSGWGEALIFIQKHLTELDDLRYSVLSFLDNWEYRLIFQYPENEPELPATKYIVAFFIKQLESEDVFWMESSSEAHKKTLISILFNLPEIAKNEITEVVKSALLEDEKRRNWRLHSFYKIVLEKFLSGLGTQRISQMLPDLIIETAWKHWKYIPSQIDESDIRHMIGDYIDDDHCWGIDEKFGFFPSGIYKTPVYNLLVFNPVKAIKFITEFINYSVDFYSKANCRFKHDVSELHITMNDGTAIKQWGGWELWVAYRGISVTDNLLECLLMSLEKYLLELAARKTEISKKNLKFLYNYLLKNSNSVMVTGVLASVAIAYPTEVEEEMLPLVSVKEIYRWESNRPMQEQSSLAPYDQGISFAQNERWKSNQLPHRRKYQRGFADFLVDYQLTIGKLNPQLKDIFDKMWQEAKPDDIIWRKKLNEIDTRKWEVSELEKDSGKFTIQPKYEEAVANFMSTGKEEFDSANKAASYSLKLTAVFEGKENIELETWKEFFTYYSTAKKFDIFHDRPITLAFIGLKEFVPQLLPEELSWCVRTLSKSIGSIIGDTNNRNHSLNKQYNLFEKDVALRSFHLLFNVVDDEESIQELTFMMLWTLITPFADHEIEQLENYISQVFTKIHPAIAKKIWMGLIHCSQYKKQNEVFYNERDAKQLNTARKKEFKFVENLIKKKRPKNIDFSEITFINSQSHLLSVAFCITPYNEQSPEYQEFILRIIHLLAEDLNKEEGSSYKRNRERLINFRKSFQMEKYLAELLLNVENAYSERIIDTLTSLVYKIKKTDLHQKGDFIDFVNKTFDLVIYKLDDFTLIEENKDFYENKIADFWKLWNYLFATVTKSKKNYFKKVLLFDTDYSWPEDRRHLMAFEGRISEYKSMLFQFKNTHIKSAIKILSTIGEKEFLPEGLSWVVEILKEYPEQITYVNTAACERLIKRLYYNHISFIKKNQTLIDNFIWLLDKMIDMGNSPAYLFRENVITYKKYS